MKLKSICIREIATLSLFLLLFSLELVKSNTKTNNKQQKQSKTRRFFWCVFFLVFEVGVVVLMNLL